MIKNKGSKNIPNSKKRRNALTLRRHELKSILKQKLKNKERKTYSDNKKDKGDGRLKSGNEDEEEELKVEFHLGIMEDDDYLSIRNFLNNLLTSANYDTSELTEIVLKQKDKVGSVVTVLNQDDMFGFISVVGIKEHWDKKCIKAIVKFVLSKTSDAKDGDEWKKIVGNPESNVGLLLSERISNLPLLLAPHMNLITLEEIKNNYDYLLLITSTYKEMDDGSRRELDPTVYYPKIEDEIYKEFSLLTHSIRCPNKYAKLTLAMYTNTSIVFMLIPTIQVPKIIKKLNAMADSLAPQ